jgi:hypothetical protein
VKYLIYLPVIGIVVPFWIHLYLDVFPFKKLYKEICIKGENKKHTIFFNKAQFKCLNRVKKKYPKYTNKIEKYIKLYTYLQRISWVSLGLIVLLWLFGVIEYKSTNESGYFTEKVTVTKIEGNKTTVKNYESLEDFLK